MKVPFGFITAILLLLTSCGGGSSDKPSRFFKPRWVDGASNPVTLKGRSAKVVYVSNHLAGNIIPIDTERRRSVDTDLFDDALTPIAVDTMLGQISVQESETDSFAYDIFAISEGNNSLYMLRANSEGSEGELFLGHSFVDIGDALKCTNSEPFFEDKGNASNPALSEIKLKEGVTKTENWLIIYSSDKKAYTVEGSLSGLQTASAVEGQTYTTDDGGLSFKIYSGSRQTTHKDNFTFGTTCVKPLSLSGKPKSFLLDSGKIFIGIYDSAKISVYNEGDFSFVQDINLNAGFTPLWLTNAGNKIWVADDSGNSIAEIDPQTYAVVYHDAGQPVSFISAIEGDTNSLYLLPASSNMLLMFSISENEVKKNLTLTDLPRSFTQVSDGENGEKRALVTNITSKVDLVDLTDWKLIDQTDRSDNESFASSAVFNDTGARSEPKAVNIETLDGIVSSQRWLFTYNGVVASTYSESGTVSGNNLSDAQASFTDLVKAGDVLVINPISGTKEEIPITSIVDDNNLTLAKIPDNTGAIVYQIRTTSSYFVMGSVSGPQKSRLVEGTTYSSDDSSISLNIIPSLNYPTTQGDTFTFTTDDGIESIDLDGKILPFHMKTVERQSDGRELVFIANEGSNDISVVEVLSERERSTID